MLKINPISIKKRAKEEAEKSGNSEELKKVYKKYLGKQGELSRILRSIKNLSQSERKSIGKSANEAKRDLEIFFKEKKDKMEDSKKESAELESVDVTAPGEKPESGHLHPLTLAKRKIEEIFQLMGFEVVEGPEMENEWYNFDALNIPKDHPARDSWDTYYLENGLLLRPHTSPVQIRYMEKNQPPLRIIVPGKCFRRDATDASHDVNFYQLEGLMVGESVNVSNFKAIIEEFLKRFFEKPVKTRLRPSFFPFTEPSFEVDASCVVCGGKGCSTCSKTGWLEMAGAGMVHPNVLKAAGLNPKNWQGFAFGFGIDRLVLMRYKINDIRLFYSNDTRFLSQFR